MTLTHGIGINRMPLFDTKEQKRTAPGLLGLKERTKMNADTHDTILKAQGAATSWERAKKLQALVLTYSKNIGSTEFTPALNFCRRFLAENKIGGYREMLDANKDLRNCMVIAMIKRFQQWIKTSPEHQTTPRPSKGDQTRPARAGAPQQVHTASRLPHPTRRRKDQKKPINNPKNIIPILQDLRNIQVKHGITTEQITEATKILQNLQETLQNVPK